MERIYLSSVFYFGKKQGKLRVISLPKYSRKTSISKAIFSKKSKKSKILATNEKNPRFWQKNQDAKHWVDCNPFLSRDTFSQDIFIAVELFFLLFIFLVDGRVDVEWNEFLLIAFEPLRLQFVWSQLKLFSPILAISIYLNLYFSYQGRFSRDGG